MSFTSLIIILFIILLAISVSYFLLKRVSKLNKNVESNTLQSTQIQKISTKSLFETSSEIVTTIIISISKQYFLSILNFGKNSTKEIVQVKKEINELNKKIIYYKKNLFVTIRALDESELESGHFYSQILDSVSDACNCLETLIKPISEHVENNHPTLPKDQIEELSRFNEKMSEYFNYSINILKNNRFESLSDLIKIRDEVINQTVILKKNQIQFLKKEGKGTKVSIVFLELMSETKNLALTISNVIEAQKDFYKHSQI